MEAFCDLHMHSCLSPCADDDMTPWNMAGMARVKGLRVIALTDHNTARNLPEITSAGAEYGVSVLPGMEITSKEEAHILGYFPTVEDALSAGGEVYAHLPDMANQPGLFGHQILIGAEDQPVGELDRLLIAATDFSAEEVCALVLRHHGVPVPAHINRGSNGMIGALGLMPMLPEYPVVEVSPQVPCPAYALKGRFLLRSSDAHHLEAIQERVFALDVEEPTAAGVFRLLKRLYAATEDRGE